MRKLEIVQRIAAETNITQAKSEEVINAILEQIKETLRQQERVIIRRFGTFEIRTKGSRPGRNPKTGKEAHIRARRMVRFKSGDMLKAATNGIPSSEEGG